MNDLFARAKHLAGRAPLRLLIDGRSGAGKTSLAKTLHEQAPQAQLLAVEAWCPGWKGLAVAAQKCADLVNRRTSRIHLWDWRQNDWGPWLEPDPAKDWIVEGCGALTRDSAAAAGAVGIWLELETGKRKKRALARDGQTYAPYLSLIHI